MNTVNGSARSLTRAAVMLALAGLLAVLSGGLLIVSGGPAQSDPAGGDLAGSTSLEDECEPIEAWTETTDWVTESPGEGWYEVDSRTVTDQEGFTELSGWVTTRPEGEGWVLVDTRTVNGDLIEDGHWQHYSWNGPWESNTEAPPFPDSRWQPNVEGDPHDVGQAGAYFRSHGSAGNGDWFYLERVEPTYAEVTEYRYEREVAPVTHEEYLFAFDHPAVECPDDPTEPTDPADPTDPTELGDGAADPDELGEDAAAPADAPDDVEVLGAQASEPTRTVPKAVEAGAAAWTDAQALGAGLAGGGVLLLTVATGAVVRARRLGMS